MVFISKFSLLILSQPASIPNKVNNIKTTRYLLACRLFTLTDRKVVILQFENPVLLSISERCEVSSRKVIGQNFSIN